MAILFQLTFICGICYMATLIVASIRPRMVRSRFRRVLNPEVYLSPFESEKMKNLFEKAGIKQDPRYMNLFRFATSIAVLLVIYGGAYIRGDSSSILPLLGVCLFILLTMPSHYSLLGWLLNKMHTNRTILRDGELISFIRLYENNRRKRNGYIQFWAFCETMAPNFEHIDHLLRLLSEKSTEMELEQALDWFVTQFPKDHPFAQDIRTIILTTEGIEDHEYAIHYLEEQNQAISRISSDLYLKRWKFIGETSTYIAAIPSLLSLIMIVVLAILYLSIIQNGMSF